ncbi:glutamate/tyrosine decarboxylase-like PLP-dependent enzyme [Azorhizobium sp. AG788]|uniref:pyridoxal phosphate-dependent decarboxylase family protein n=1 Tax=Azorhizobium sp. AG788 TaxID=2183897 RepID=UPI00105F29F5|nr:aminotransferase class V-fold PLP-dependent enzyme [Azorhizobium sp. AG788]TDU00589.1 glutamate/tyrosine decarboxylase-like PLP-dependent enzyme [Azorhizobium sp. AG788]
MREPTLDPADWSALRAVFHQAVDDGLAHLQGALDTPVWVAPPDGSKSALHEPLPRTAMPAAEVYETFRTHVLPYGVGNVRPAFYGWVHGAGNAEGVLGELMAAFMNCNVGGRAHMANELERVVVDWCKDFTGLPAEASGLLTSGTSMATVLAIATARHVHADGDIGREGVAVAGRGLVGYASTEAHSCIAKAFDLLGLGRNALRAVPVNAAREMDIAALDAMIAADRAAGLKPFVVAATVGTVNTGAIDDIAGIGALAHREGMWFHVDAAFGIGALFSDAHKAKAAPMAQAESIAFDFHKWFQVPYDAGIVLIRDAKAHYETFAGRKEYLASSERGLAAGEPWYCDYGPELSRTFRALKVWFTLKSHGVDGISAIIAKNIAQARYLEDKVAAEPRLELLSPASLNIVCFRYVAPCDTAALNQLNKDIVADLQEAGIAAPSTTTLNGRTAIRVCLVNHRTRRQDLDALLAGVLELGARRTAASAAA